MNDFKVDVSRCTRCGLCLKACHPELLALDPFPVMIEGAECTLCRHCLAVCPVGAVSVGGLAAEDCPPLTRRHDPAGLKNLILSRRSMRHYKPKDLPRECIDDLIATAWNAPTGANRRALQYSVLYARADLKKFRRLAYQKVAESMKDPALKQHPALPYMRHAVMTWVDSKEDIMFRGAPHAVVVSSSPEAATGDDDAVISLSFFELYAQSQGLGVLWNALLTWAIKDFAPCLRVPLGIPPENRVHHAMVFGYPDVKYARAVPRGPAKIFAVKL